MRIVPVLGGVLAAFLAFPLAAAPAGAAAPAVRVTKIYYDSPGSDRGGDSSLNGEYVTLMNTTKRAIALKGWTIRDKTGFRYSFGPVVLKAGKKITLRSGRGRDGTSTVYWNRRWYVWNNDEDAAYLRNAGGRLVDSCEYDNENSDYVTC